MSCRAFYARARGYVVLNARVVRNIERETQRAGIRLRRFLAHVAKAQGSICRAWRVCNVNSS